MSLPRDPRDLIVSAARALGPVLDEIVVVGGCAPVLYELGPTVSPLRPTLDLDCIVDAKNRREYYALIDRWEREVGLRHVTREGAPICRYEVGGVDLDLMPIDPGVLGFSNAWFSAAADNAQCVEVEPGVVVRVVTPVYLVALKLDALSDRGTGDLRADEDLEDIVTVLRGVAGLVDELARETEPVHAFVRDALATIVANPDALEIVGAHFESDVPTQALVSPFVKLLRTACV